MPLALTDSQLHRVMAVAQTLAVEKRDTFLRRLAAELAGMSGRPSDHDVERAVQRALRGLIHAPAAEVLIAGP
jgi:hypothetical protein